MFRRLDPAAFARVDAAYLQGFDAACGSLRGKSSSGLVGVGEEQLQLMLAELVRDSPTRRQTVARLRGAQAGFLAHGLLLTVPAARDMLDVLSGPGLSSVPVTRWLVDRIRGGVAHPVIAAGLAATLFTGMRPPALLHSRLDEDAVRVIYRPTISRRPSPAAGLPDSVITAIFPIPPAARPLLRAADHFARYALPDARRRLFTPAAMTTEQITAAAAACRIIPPDQSADLVAPWQSRIACAPIDAVAPHSRSCSHPDWTTGRDIQDHAVMTDAGRGGQPPSTPELDYDDPPAPGRRPLTTNTAAGILQLIADHFRAVPALQRSTRDPARSWLMIRQQLAFHPRTADGSVTDEGLTPHSDVLFALRLTDNPTEMTYPERAFTTHIDR
jgi:hypothetical protein